MSSRIILLSLQKKDVLEIHELFNFYKKNKCLLLTFTPRIKENVCVCFWVSASADYAIGGPDSNIHAEFPHNALWGRLDRQPDRLVLSHDNFSPPRAMLQLWYNRYWDVGSLVLLRIATYEKKEETQCWVHFTNHFLFSLCYLNGEGGK